MIRNVLKSTWIRWKLNSYQDKKIDIALFTGIAAAIGGYTQGFRERDHGGLVLMRSAFYAGAGFTLVMNWGILPFLIPFYIAHKHHLKHRQDI